jgi:hypothetical protein
MEKRLERGVPVTVRAIDLVITDLQSREHAERDEQLELLHHLRSELLAEANESREP